VDFFFGRFEKEQNVLWMVGCADGDHSFEQADLMGCMQYSCVS
jgi:hypothetical protein